MQGRRPPKPPFRWENGQEPPISRRKELQSFGISHRPQAKFLTARNKPQPPTAATPSPNAERSKRTREHRNRGLISLRVDAEHVGLEHLLLNGYLRPNEQDDRAALERATGRMLADLIQLEPHCDAR